MFDMEMSSFCIKHARRSAGLLLLLLLRWFFFISLLLFIEKVRNPRRASNPGALHCVCLGGPSVAAVCLSKRGAASDLKRSPRATAESIWERSERARRRWSLFSSLLLPPTPACSARGPNYFATIEMRDFFDNARVMKWFVELRRTAFTRSGWIFNFQ